MYIPRYLLAGSLCGAIAVSSAGCWGYSPNVSGRNGSDADQYQPDPGQYGGQDDSGQYGGDADDYDQYDQPVEYANEAPPPLPEYEQPMCPGEGYIWTPGYWYWGSEGFYWVPGAWVYAPYQGALWTPGYWGYHGRRYGWHHGFWGRHVGYYGGINYGYGYTGYGYEGGRWDGDRFAYNRAVNNVNITVIHNVYERPIANNRGNRMSYNGPGGIRVRPRPAEIQAIREPHNAPMSSQLQHAREAQQIRQNFARVNHGRPQVMVDQRPIQADRNVRPPAAVPMRQGGAPAPVNDRRGEQPRAGQPNSRGDLRLPNGRTPEPRVNERPSGSEPSAEPRGTPRANPARPVAPMRTQPPLREQQPQTRQDRQDRAAPMPRPERPQTMPERQAPERHAQPAPERQAPQVRRPMPQERRPAPERRPESVPQQRPERPAAPPRQEQQRPAREERPAQSRPAPNPHANPRATEQKPQPHHEGERKPQ